ncbi:MAG TPA: DNA polymerase domain-containing protein [Methanomassiliicoccales archaeon]|jgi:DNA polymerase elongation subunit (family B)
MRGWIIDCYADTKDDSMVLWLWTAKGVRKIVDRKFRPAFYVWAPEGKLAELRSGLSIAGIGEQTVEKHRTWLGEKKRDVVKIVPDCYLSLMPTAKMIDRWGLYRDYRLFNVDFRMDHRYYLAHGIFPMGLLDTGERYHHLDQPYRLDYPIPNLKVMRLDIKVNARNHIPTYEDPLRSASLGGDEVDGTEEDVLQGVLELVRRKDPDIILTQNGDSFYLPYLSHRAEKLGMEFDLGREKGVRNAKGKSYFTYGRIVYKPPAQKLRGRIHIDADSSFTFEEGGLYGLIDMTRMSRISLQEMSRLSPGTAISSMQVNEAVRCGTLVLWKKNLPENFKTAGELIVSDRGGFIYEPKVGIHDRVAEFDFASLYPSIMVVHNISPETLQCDCCPDSRLIVPEIGYRICERGPGLLPRVLGPIVHRRLALKKLAKSGSRNAKKYDSLAKALKWLLVTCFGYTGYRNARFGRIECHEAINAFGREILLRTSALAEQRGFRVLHGIVDSLWLQGDGDTEAFATDVKKIEKIPLVLDGIYNWIVFLPNITTGVGALNRYYGVFESGEVKIRGIALRKHDTTTIVRELQQAMLDRLAKCKDSREFREAIPEVLDIVGGYVETLRSGSVPLDKLVIRKSVSKELEEYTQHNESFEALQQMKRNGFSVPPGEAIEYVVLAGEERVKVAKFLDGDETYDPEKYVELSLRAASELLVPFGYDIATMRMLFSNEEEQGAARDTGATDPPRPVGIAPAELERYETEPAVDHADLFTGQTVQEYVAEGAEGGEEQYLPFAGESGDDG